MHARTKMTESIATKCGFAPDWGFALSGTWWHHSGEGYVWGLSNAEDCDLPLDPRDVALCCYELTADGEMPDRPFYAMTGTLREALEALSVSLPEAVPFSVMGATVNKTRHVARRRIL